MCAPGMLFRDQSWGGYLVYMPLCMRDIDADSCRIICPSVSLYVRACARNLHTFFLAHIVKVFSDFIREFLCVIAHENERFHRFSIES